MSAAAGSTMGYQSTRCTPRGNMANLFDSIERPRRATSASVDGGRTSKREKWLLCFLTVRTHY